MQKRSKKLLAFLLCLVMVLSAFPMGVLAAEDVTYSQISSADELTSGKYVMVVNTGYAPTVLEGSWVLAEKVSATDGTITNPAANLVWNLTVDGNAVSITDSNGKAIAPAGGNNNGIKSSDYKWAFSCTNGAFVFSGQGTDTVSLASNKGSSNRFRAYKNATIAGNVAGYPSEFTLYKLDAGGTTPNPEPSPEVSPDPSTPPSEAPQLEIVPISTALAGAADTEFKVKGVVTLVDGKNVYLQDDTGAICVRMAAEFSDISLGDTIIGTGKRADYNGLPQLGSAAYEKSSGLTLSAKAATIASLSAADVCSYVKLEKLTVESIAGTTINLSDGTNSIQLYKAVTDGLAIAEGDIIDICAAVGIFSGKPQLRNTLPDEITIVDKAPESTEPPQEEKPVIADGNYVIYAPSYNKALSSTKTGNYNVGVDVSISSGVMSGFAATEVWTVKNNSDGTISIAQNDKKLGMASQYSSMNLGAENDAWEIVSLGNDLYNVKNVGRGNYIEWYAQYSNWSTYNSSYAATDGQFQLAFYPVTQIPEVPPTPSEPPQDEEPVIADGRYIIWAPGYNMSISSVYAGFYNTGVAVEESNGVLSGYSASEIWEVENNSDGTISISYGGKKLAMAANYSSLSLGEVNDKWVLEDAGDGLYYVKNTVRGSYIEWYADKNNWSGYYKITDNTKDMFALKFTPAPQYAKLDNEIADGDEFVIYYNKGEMVVGDEATGKKLKGVDATLKGDYVLVEEGMAVLTAAVDKEGIMTLANADGKYLTSGATGNSLSFEEKPNDYSLWTVKAVDGGVHIVNVNAKYNGNAQALEYYSGFTTFSEKNNDYYLFNLYKLTDELPSEGGLAEGSMAVLYNLSAEGVLAAENDTKSIENAAATVNEGVATPANGGVVFKISKNGEYWRFYNETYGYLCSNGTGNNAFYSKEASNDADWTVTPGKSGGYFLESRTAKFNGQYSQYLEFYSDAYKTYSMYNVTDYDIYEFFFYPVAEGVNITGGIVNDPVVDFGTVYDAFIGTDYTFGFTVDAVFGVDGALTVMVNQKTLSANEDGTYTVPAEDVYGESLAISVSGKDTKGVDIIGRTVVTVKDEPVISDISPAANSQTGADKRPTVSVSVVNAGEGAEMTMTLNGEEVEAVFENGVFSYTPAKDMEDGRVSVNVKVVRADGKEAEKTWAFIVGRAQYQLYFGQLHSHTTYSDGSGSLGSALDYIKGLPANANVDFVAFTDHSNYFDASGAANPEEALYDMSKATAASQKTWSEYVGTIDAFNEKNTDIIAIPGFEMTWSGGPGHINTFNTEGIVSRNNSTLNNKTADAGMKAYYALLSRPEGADSINQFNHPGTTFGNFSDFAYWDAVIDTRIQLVEVGNGEGAIGAGGYYPSYEEYTLALDKGWHVAPTNNQDNHKGKWGNANDARDVILTDNFTEKGLYEAIRNYRVYATEDKNLEINYLVNDMLMGSIIKEVPEKLNVSVTVYDPDRSDSISKVEVIVNSGKVAYTWSDPAELADGALEAVLDPSYSYYYIRVTEGDGDIAVTAPVWVGETLKLGISSVETTTSTPVTDEELTITTNFFNSESSGATVKSLVYTVGGEVIGTDSSEYTIPASGNASVDFAYTPDTAKLTNVTVTAIVEQEGVEYTFSMDIELDVQDADKLVYIGIDASHYNEYVNGNYKDSMGNFSQLAAEYNVRTVTLYESEELIAACDNDKYVALILTAPSRRSAEAQAADPLKVYTDEELAAIKAYNENGGTVILAGWSDHYENYPDVASITNMKAEEHMAATQNAVLEALGSTLRIGDDATYDDNFNGGQAYRLYFNSYNFDSFLVDGVEVDLENPHDRLYTEVYSHYGGASVYTVDGKLSDTVTPVVFGHSGTYSVDVDKDGLGGDSMNKYAYADGDNRLMVLASEQLDGKGLIIVSGAAFMSNFEVQATIEDSGSEKNYSNYKICENLLAYLNPVSTTPIAEVQAQTEAGYKYTIEGIVTSNASGYDKDTAFFDCIYVQDETGGICCFPVAGNFKIGDKVRVTGTTEFYQGEMELQVSDIQLIGSGSVEAKNVKAAQVNDGSVIGQLITVKGSVVSYEEANGLVQTIMVKDGYGNVVRVFIDGYITTDKDVQNLAVGNLITVTGLASYDNTFNAPEGPFPRIRIRDRADIVCTRLVAPPDEPVPERFPFTDVESDDWFYGDVFKIWKADIMNGVSETLFAPQTTLNRAMFATMIYRLSGEEYEGEGSAFEDVEEGKWYSDAIAWCAEKGVVTGFSETVFGPESPVTREQAAAMLYRYAEYKGYDVSAGEKTDLSDFTDADNVSSYAENAVKWAVGAGVIRGMTEDTIVPTDSSTRAQIACMFNRFIAWCE